MLKVNNKGTKMTPLPCSIVFVVNFEQEIAKWVTSLRSDDDLGKTVL